MTIQTLPFELTVCKLPGLGEGPRASLSEEVLEQPFFFLSQTDEELSLVCETRLVPEKTLAREDGWRAFRIEGILDFSLIGILSSVSSLLAKEEIPVFAVSTYHTDYILLKAENLPRALSCLEKAGYEVNASL